MCGICGFTTNTDSSFDKNKKIIEDMCDIIAHRGPDGSGYMHSSHMLMGHRRLSLIDLSGGAQPMTRDAELEAKTQVPDDGAFLSAVCRYTIVFNGEIYNYRELRMELSELGYAFNRDSDTEVLLVSFIAWGEKCLEHLRGMFAFAVWDNTENKLFCARDYFGIKPFYYMMDDGIFAFASEIKSILEHPGYNASVNYDALNAYMSFQYSVLEETFFSGIMKLMPAHCMTVTIDNDGTAVIDDVHRWWKPTYDIDDSMGMEEAAGKISHAMQESVSFHKIADVEVGSFLSSGVDSNYLAASLAQQETDIKTFTVGFAEQGRDVNGNDDGHKYSEIGYAEEAAKWMGVDNISHVITQDEFWEAFPKAQWHMDEPLADPAAIALWFVDREAAKHVKAVLSGEGADEFFGGYTIYQTPCENEKIQWIPKPLLRFGGKLLRALGMRGANYLYRASTPLVDQFIGNANIFNTDERDKVLNAHAKDAMNKNIYNVPSDVTASYYADVAELDDTTQMQYIDLNLWLVGDILLKTDKMAMAHSLESRVPFLDREVWQIARQLPQNDKVSCEGSKLALRKAAAKTMPEQFTEKTKLGFPVPIRVWLTDAANMQRVMDVVTTPYGQQVFDADYVRQLLDEHAHGEKDNSRKIWCVYAFLVWHDAFFGNDEQDENLVVA